MVESHQNRATHWTPRDYAVLMTVVTACLCLVILVLGILFLMASGKITADALGDVDVTSVGVGSGLVGLATVIAWVIKVALARGADS